MTDNQYLDGFIGELLHINEVADNKLIDLGASGGNGSYVLNHTCIDLSSYTLNIIGDRIGKTGNTVLLNSAKNGGEQRVNRNLNTFEWRAYNGGADVAALHAFIATARKDLIARGNNPLFLGVGAVKWRVSVKERGKDILKDITTPLLIFPVKLNIANNNAPVAIEFIDDEIYINPCLIAKFTQVFGEELAEGLPKIGGAQDFNSPVDIKVLGDGSDYFKAMAAYVESCNHTDGADSTRFEFDKDFISIAQYKHDELCTYYDIRRHKEQIYTHPLVDKLFSKSSPSPAKPAEVILPDYVLMRDSVQEKMITRAVNGESLVIKGPPGTGKTVTIANMIAALLSQNKKVLFASKKISALTEVYAKLPDRLRKFAMLLDSETEKNAAKIRPEEIKQDFKRLLNDAKEYREPPQLKADVRQAQTERRKALIALSMYIETMFNNKCIAGDSFYAALDAMCRIDMPVIEFDGEDKVKITSRAEYNHMLEQAGEAEKAFGVLGNGGAHSVFKCPWFGIDLECDTEKAMADCVAIGAAAEYVYAVAESGLKDCGLDTGAFTLDQIRTVSESVLDGVQIETLFTDERCACVSEISARLNEYNNLPRPEYADVFVADGDVPLKSSVAGLDRFKGDLSLTLGQIELINANAAVFTLENGQFIGKSALSSLAKITEDIEKAEEKIIEHVSKSREVFKSDLNDEQNAFILDSCAALSGYFDGSRTKPKALDFKAKKTFAKLASMSFLSSPSFLETVNAVKEYSKASDYEKQVQTLTEGMYRFFHKQLTGEQVRCVRLIAKKCANAQVNAQEYVIAVTDNYGFLAQCYKALPDNIAQDTAVSALIALYAKAYGLERLREQLVRFNLIVPVYAETDAGREVEIAKSVIDTLAFIEVCKAQNADCANAVNAALFLQSRRTEIVRSVGETLIGLENFGVNRFRNFYVINGGSNTLADLKILEAQADDRNVIAAAATYTAIKNNPLNTLDLRAFLYWFEKGGVLPDGVNFKDAFEHSFFALAVRAMDKQLGILRNGMGAKTANNLERLRDADERLNNLNAAVIESKTLSRIKPHEEDYIFIQDRNPNENLRLMFKRHGQAILKLKRCLILSPYTASLLFYGKEFEDFDVLIVDEASQLEPALVLPVLFRSRQCIIVGDEWQMPPIKHFATLSPVQDDDSEDGYGSLEPEISVLGLALRNQGFPVEELICHYRSKTETLIKFSQESFYPNMRTFPAPVPATVADRGVIGLGLRDAYVPEGFVSSGKNEAEAKRVVEELNRHFDNYYDETTHELAMSVGVIAFGESQCAAIEAKVRADTKLNAKIRRALDKFDDLPEKLIFFKTIETVQGQEVGHVILSITHGKRESGPFMHFGQLNQGKLGRCIFNVAVTRAQCMVTVVHSVRASEITASNVSYIKDYLQTVERFAETGRDQFVCEKAGRGFLNDVCKFIQSKGVAPERIVVNYGITEGSVRIPVAVLSKDLKRALLGVWCEKPVGAKYDFIDYNMRYKNSLESCGWKLHTLYLHDWTDNRQNEQESLEKAIADILNNEEENN